MLDSFKQKKNFQRIKMRIKTGDLVKVINGKEKGKTGEVLKTIPLENRVIVKGINLRTKHVKPTQEGETGRILTEEASLHASNVMFFSMDKTVVVAVINRYPHPTYKKIVSRTTRYKAHDPENTCVMGDRVKIKETRPLSAHKRWAIEEILNKTNQAKEVKKWFNKKPI